MEVGIIDRKLLNMLQLLDLDWGLICHYQLGVMHWLLLAMAGLCLLEAKSLYRHRVTENEIWAGFGLVGNTEKKKLGQLRATFEASFFMFSGAFFFF